jgi:hypothetical protein
MADYPDFLDPARHRDARGRRHQPWVRRAFLALFSVVIVLGLLNVFGQRSDTSRAASPAVAMEVRGPTKVRGGLLFQERITVRAAQTLHQPRLVLGRGWADGLQINTIEPQPSSEASRGGRIVLSYDALGPGDVLVVYVDYQADPTHVGNTDMGVELDEAARPVIRIPRTLTTFP